MGGGLVEVLKHLILQQIGVYQYLTKKFMPPGGGWMYKSKKNSENVFFNLKVDHGLSLKSGNSEFMSKNIRIFCVEAVWKRTDLPQHLPSI